MGIFNQGYGRSRGGGGGGRLIIGLIIAAVGIVGYLSKEKFVNPETGKTYRRALNPDEQKALGLQAARDMIPQMGGAADPRKDPDAAMVAEVGSRIVQVLDSGRTPYVDNFHFYLVNDSNTINAFALPGGQVSITRGLYDRLENEAQLAGVLGHEIGHVIAEHSAQQMAKGQLGQALATAAGISSDDGRIAMASQLANQMLQLSYGRDDERESDNIGLKYMTRAGFNPEGMLGVMKVLAEASKGNRQPKFLASHPYPEERLQTIQKFLDDNKTELGQMKLTQGRSLHSADRR